MNIVAMWLGLPKWVRDAIMIGGAVLAVIFLGKQYVKAKQDEAVQRNNDKRDTEERKEHERTVETVTRIEQETEDAKDRAIAAPDYVDDVASADELRDRYPENAKIILRPRDPGSRSGPR